MYGANLVSTVISEQLGKPDKVILGLNLTALMRAQKF
jgi:hypothetical protein